jgi:hypothetical protein
MYDDDDDDDDVDSYLHALVTFLPGTQPLPGNKFQP